ncbi:MAG: hydrogenase maturation protease [Deltaproteobacteria bacterium]|nr:hydrogenase maturation protease [Deltaproteobacteria bacterium]
MGLTVIGVGSWLSRDDAIGLMLVDELAARPPRPDLDFHTWEGVDALTITHDMLALSSPILVVDCADLGLAPGEWRFFDAESARLHLHGDTVSTHGFGLADALEMARGLGFEKPVHVFGVQPFDLAPGTGLSDEMRHVFGRLLENLSDAAGRISGAT